MANTFSASIRLGLFCTAAWLLPEAAFAEPVASPSVPQTADAQAGTQAPAGAAQDNSNSGDAIVITGTSRARRAFNTPLAVTTLDQTRLQRIASSSQADILNTVGTIKADAGGGEVASNVFIRGLPSGGQYQFTPLMYDGLPVLSTFGLNSSAYDVYYRNDLGIDRLEFVRGGVSNLFGPGSVAGLINYISRTGHERTSGVAQLEVAEKGRYRGDVAVSGPLAENLFYAVSGYYRWDEGPIKTGLDTKGYQIRGNLRYRFPDDSGSITVSGQWIDDQVQFYLPIPLDGTTRHRIPGNDGHTVFSVQTPDVLGISYNTPDGVFHTHIGEGAKTKGGQIALAFDKKFADGWGLNGRVKYSKYATRFGLWSGGDGVINAPETLQSFLTNRGLGNLANASYTFADGSGAVPSNFRVFANRFTDRYRPMKDFTAELNLTRNFQTGSASHTFTLGGFMGEAWARDENVTTRILAEFNNEPRLINLTVTNPNTGAVTIVSNGGVLDRSVANYVNNRAKATRYATYIADQIDAGRFQFDIGGRVEHFRSQISRERVSTFLTNTTPANQTTALQDVSWGNDAFLTGRVSTTQWAIAAGALYKLTPQVNLYANGSRGYFFPEIRSITFASPLPTPVTVGGSPGTQSYTGEIIKQAEVGVKYHNARITGTLAGLYTRLDNRRQVNFINAPGGGFQEQVNIVATEAYGLEATLSWRILDNLRFDGNLTLQHHEYKKFSTNGVVQNIGNRLERQPYVLYNAGLYYDDGNIDASIFTNYTGETYTASNNAILLHGFNVATLDAGYTLHMGGDRKVRLGVNVFNLFNSDASTEGDPRQDVNQPVGGQYFVGRPVLPRRIAGRLTFNF